jgi:hypothetical protein
MRFRDGLLHIYSLQMLISEPGNEEEYRDAELVLRLASLLLRLRRATARAIHHSL